MPSIKLTAEDARDIVFDDYEGAVLLETTIVDKTRWMLVKKAIFSLNGRFYSVTYQVGATEYQSTKPFECDKFVACKEVHQVDKVVKVWEPVP